MQSGNRRSHQETQDDTTRQHHCTGKDKCERPRAGARSYAIRGAEPRDQARREEVADIRRHRKHTRDCGCDSLSSSGVGHDSSPYP